MINPTMPVNDMRYVLTAKQTEANNYLTNDSKLSVLFGGA